MSPENHDCGLHNLYVWVTIGQIICEKTRAGLDKIEQVLASPTKVEQAVTVLLRRLPLVNLTQKCRLTFFVFLNILYDVY